MQAKPERHERGGGPRRIRVRGPRADGRRFDCAYLDSIGICVPTRELDRRDMTELVIEDLCWCIAMAAWVDGRPSRRRRRARAQWRAEGEQLRARRQELAKMAREAGIWP